MSIFTTPALRTARATKSVPLARMVLRQRPGVSKASTTQPSLRELKVLVVDDKPETADGLARLLRVWGHAPRASYDSFSALRVAAIQHPDVVLLNLDMPVLGGCEIVKQLRMDFPRRECFVIAFTARADQQREHLCQQAGIDLLLVNPVDPSVLETLLMLELVLANRAHLDSTVRLAPKQPAQSPPRYPAARERVGIAKLSSA